jgi:dUTP pyrophosphatase
MKILKVQKLHKEAKLPTRAHKKDAGYDIYALEDIYCDLGRSCTIPTGIALGVEDGYFAMVTDKSSIARTGFKVTAGVVDAGYTGEVSVELLNVTGFAKLIKKGQKVAQFIILPIARPEIVETSQLESSERGLGSFGSSGSF